MRPDGRGAALSHDGRAPNRRPLEEETGTSNLIVTPGLFQQNRLLLRRANLLLVAGVLQKVDGVMAIRARRFAEPTIDGALPLSNDFH
jgi:error-prone DNA polymerase